MVKPILVTGSHRSGTTWVGKMISKSPYHTYVHEPFSPENKRLWSLGFNKWFKYLTAENESPYLQEIRSLLEFNYSLKTVTAKAYNEASSLKGCVRFFRDYVTYLPCKFRGLTPIIKDPFAVLSSEWFAHRWDIEVIVMIRHPAGFAGSLKVKGWTFPFSHFLKQPLLINGPLASFEEEIRAMEDKNHDVIDEAGLLWRIIYSVVDGCDERYENHRIIKHEELAVSPIKAFKNLYESLGLNFTREVRKMIRHHSGKKGQEARKSIVYGNNIRRDSKSVTQNWKTRLTKEEVKRLRSLTEPLASRFYGEDEW